MEREALMTAIYENMIAVRKGMYAHLHQAVGDYAVSPAQLHMLFTIKQYQPINAKQLAGHLHMTAGAISQVVDTLHQLGMIERAASLTDRRVHVLTLSRQGQECLKAIEDKRRATMGRSHAKPDDRRVGRLVARAATIIRSFQ